MRLEEKAFSRLNGSSYRGSGPADAFVWRGSGPARILAPGDEETRLNKLVTEQSPDQAIAARRQVKRRGY